MGLAVSGRFAWEIQSVHLIVDPTLNTYRLACRIRNERFSAHLYGKNVFLRAKSRMYAPKTLSSWRIERFLVGTSVKRVTIIYPCHAFG